MLHLVIPFIAHLHHVKILFAVAVVSSPSTNLYPLTIEEIEQVAAGFKDDLLREGKRCVRRKDLDRALAAFAAEEYVDNFVDALRMKAGSQLGRPKEPKKRIRAIYIPESVKRMKPPARVVPTEEEANTQRHAREVVAATRSNPPKWY